MDKRMKDEKPALIFISDEEEDLKFLFKPQLCKKSDLIYLCSFYFLLYDK